jgi:transposase
MDRGYFWLNDVQFERLEAQLPTNPRGKPRVDERRVISGIVHVLLSGCRWKDAPAVYDPRKTLYNRFQRWAAKGVWSKLFHALATADGPRAELLIDSSARRTSLVFGWSQARSRPPQIARPAVASPPPIAASRSSSSVTS